MQGEGDRTRRRERGQEKAKRENEGVSLGTKRRKTHTMETEDGESGKKMRGTDGDGRLAQKPVSQ